MERADSRTGAIEVLVNARWTWSIYNVGKSGSASENKRMGACQKATGTCLKEIAKAKPGKCGQENK